MASSGGVQLALAPNYLRQFRDSSSLELRRLSAVQFMAVWEHYDTDGGVTSKAVNKISWNVHNFLRKIRKSRSQQISKNKVESQLWDKGSLLTKPSNGNRFFNSRHFPKGGGPSRVLLWMLWKHLQNFVDTSSDTVTGELMLPLCCRQWLHWRRGVECIPERIHCFSELWWKFTGVTFRQIWIIRGIRYIF